MHGPNASTLSVTAPSRFPGQGKVWASPISEEAYAHASKEPRSQLIHQALINLPDVA